MYDTVSYNTRPVNADPNNRNIYYYNQFLDDVNYELLLLWQDALADGAYTADGIIPASLRPQIIMHYAAPYFRIARNGNIIELCITSDISVNPSSAFTLSNPNGINIVMSPKLFYFFSGFSAYDYGTAGIAGNLNLRYKLQLYQRPTNVFPRSIWNNVPNPA